MTTFGAIAGKCDQVITPPNDTYRNTNAPSITPIAMIHRCMKQMPEHWGADERKREDMAMRWLNSGGDIGVFGICEASNCPYLEQSA